MRNIDYFNNYSFRLICKVIDSARKAPFWQRKLPDSNIKNMGEFRQLPITTRNQLNEIYDCGRWNELLTTYRKKSHIIVSSGGRPYRSPFISCLSKKEFNEMSLSIADMLLNNGIKNGSILIIFPGVMPYPPHILNKIWPENDIEEYQSLHISGVLFKHACIRCNLKTFCSGLRFLAYKVSEKEAAIESERIMRAYSIVKPEILAFSPNVLRNIFFPELKKRGHTFRDYNTKIIISGGSKLREDDYDQIQHLGNPKIIVWIESGELGTIGYSKAFLALQSQSIFYYTSWRQNFFETVDKDGRALPFGKRGRIVVTRLKTFVQPLIRYDLEDEGEFFILGNKLILGKDILKL